MTTNKRKTRPGGTKATKRTTKKSAPPSADERPARKRSSSGSSKSSKGKKKRKAKTTRPRVATEVRAKVVEEQPASERRLDLILRALPAKELSGLIRRLNIRVDEAKRIDTPAQVARALVRLPDVREPSRLPPASGELLRRVAEANGTLVVTALPAGVETLVRRGVVYARMTDAGIELVLPTAFLVQMRSWEGEDPRSLRALLSEAPFETASAIASHYLNRPSTPPIALSLEPAWETLGNPSELRAEIERVSHEERRLLEQIERVGGEVDTQELMDLEREPMRVRGAYGVAAGRRGAAFSLEKRGLLFPLHPNRYVLPTEVATIIGAERRHEREERRAKIRTHVVEEDHLPRRAQFSFTPAPLALALTMWLRQTDTEVRGGVGTPRSLVSRMAQRFGREGEVSALIVALSRAVGLWERESVVPTSPPGSLTVAELDTLLFQTWRRGGAWDEAREEPEMLRVSPEHRDTSPVGVVREMVLDALGDLGEDQWVPYLALRDYIAEDPRMEGTERLLTRWAKRVGVDVPDPLDIAARVLTASLPALGVVDLGGADRDAATGSGELSSLALRLTRHGRQLLGDGGRRQDSTTEMAGARKLRVGSDARVADVLALTPFVELGGVERGMELEVSSGAVARGLGLGVQADEMKQLLAAVCDPSPELLSALEQAGTVVGRASLVAASAFLWVDDREVRDLLLSSSGASELFVEPSPPSGLLVAPNAGLDRVVRRCRALGVDVQLEEGMQLVAKSTVPPPAKRRSSSSNLGSWRPPPAGKRGLETG